MIAGGSTALLLDACSHLLSDEIVLIASCVFRR
jgi:hypothetical protein